MKETAPGALTALLAAALLAAAPARAQWTRSLPPQTPKIFALAALDGRIFAGFEIGIFRSSDQGSNWAPASAGLSDFSAVYCLASDGSVLYTGTVSGGVFKSNDRGGSWTAAGLPGGYISALAASDGRLYAGTCCGGLWISPDSGSTWRKAATDTGYVSAIHAQGGTVFAGIRGGYFRSSDHGETWERLDVVPGAEDSASGAFAAAGGAFYAGTRGGLYRSLDGGAHWTRTGLAGGTVASLAADAHGLFAAQWEGISFSPDAGATWSRVDSGLPEYGVSCLVLSGGQAFAGVSSQGVWRRPIAEMIAPAPVKPAGKAAGAKHAMPALLPWGGVGFAADIPEASPAYRDARGRRSPGTVRLGSGKDRPR